MQIGNSALNQTAQTEGEMASIAGRLRYLIDSVEGGNKSAASTVERLFGPQPVPGEQAGSNVGCDGEVGIVFDLIERLSAAISDTRSMITVLSRI